LEKERADITHEINESLAKINDEETHTFANNFLKVIDVIIPIKFNPSNNSIEKITTRKGFPRNQEADGPIR